MATTKMPARYTAARQELAAAYEIDEVKEIRDKAIALKAYAAQCKDDEMMRYVVGIRKRAERRLGELMAETKAAGKMAKGCAR
jgi:hypothetical protein